MSPVRLAVFTDSDANHTPHESLSRNAVWSTRPIGCAYTFSPQAQIGLSGWLRNAVTAAGTLNMHYELYTRCGPPTLVVHVSVAAQWTALRPARAEAVFAPERAGGSAAGTATVWFSVPLVPVTVSGFQHHREPDEQQISAT
jgi:hypothetical protein